MGLLWLLYFILYYIIRVQIFAKDLLHARVRGAIFSASEVAIDAMLTFVAFGISTAVDANRIIARFWPMSPILKRQNGDNQDQEARLHQ